VALVLVELVVKRLVIVEVAWFTRMPPVKVRSVEVALPGNGSWTLDEASVPQDSTPAVLDFTSHEAAFKPETTREVEDAVPLAVIAVVEAYGIVIAEVRGAVKREVPL